MSAHPTPLPKLGFGLRYAGFYDGEPALTYPRAVWMGPSAAVRLPSGGEGELRLEGFFDQEILQRASGSRTQTLRLWAEGRECGALAITRPGRFEAAARVTLGEGLAGTTLGLVAQHTVVPARLGLNADPRELSLRVSRLLWKGEAVLDFSKAEAPYVAAEAGGEPLGVNLVGYVQGEFGIGQSVRNAALALEAAGIPFVMVDVGAGEGGRALDTTWAHRIEARPTHPVTVLHVNADQLPFVRERLGEEFFEGRYTVGYWHWELPEFPDRWLGAFSLVDEVWAPSRFVADALSAKSPVPVVRIPHALSVPRPAGAGREAFGLPQGRFLFLLAYDMHSYQERKNPAAAVRAFLRAFPDGRAAGLVIKTQNGADHPESLRELQEMCAGHPGIVLLDRTLSRQEVFDLEACCDAFLSLHRSEGFGLGLLECMLLGKPVVATGWSANTDFMDARNSCPVDCQLVPLARDVGPYGKGQRWAEPDEAQAARLMTRLVEDAPWRESLALAGQRAAREFSDPVAVGTRVLGRLRIIQEILAARR